MSRSGSIDFRKIGGGMPRVAIPVGNVEAAKRDGQLPPGTQMFHPGDGLPPVVEMLGKWPDEVQQSGNKRAGK